MSGGHHLKKRAEGIDEVISTGGWRLTFYEKSSRWEEVGAGRKQQLLYSGLAIKKGEWATKYCVLFGLNFSPNKVIHIKIVPFHVSLGQVPESSI